MERNRGRWRRWLLVLSLLLLVTNVARCGGVHPPVSVVPDETPRVDMAIASPDGTAAVRPTRVAIAIPARPRPTPTKVAIALPPGFHDAEISLGQLGFDVSITHHSDGFLVDLHSGAPWGALPAVHDGVLIAGGGSSRTSTRLYGFDAHDGTPLWVFNLQDDGVFAPACDAGLCAFTTESCSLYVIDVKNGLPVWGKWLGDPLRGAPAISGGTVYAMYPASWTASGIRASVAAFDARTGAVSWTRNSDSSLEATLIVKRDRLSVAGAGGVEERDVATGKLRVFRRGGLPAFGVSLPGCDVLRSGSALSCVDAQGREVWETAVLGPTDPILAGGSILVGTQQGQILRIDPASGEIVHRWEAGAAVRSEPLADGGWIYASTTKGIVAVDTQDPSITGWPQWGGNGAHSLAVVDRRPEDAVPDVNALLNSLADPSPTPAE